MFLGFYINFRQFVLTNDGRFQVHKDGPGHVFARASLTEERVEGVIPASHGLVAGHLSVRLDAVFQTVELPASIAHLHASLADMDADALTLQTKKMTVSFPVEILS